MEMAVKREKAKAENAMTLMRRACVERDKAHREVFIYL